jgi:hypothetical protein
MLDILLVGLQHLQIMLMLVSNAIDHFDYLIERVPASCAKVPMQLDFSLRWNSAYRRNYSGVGTKTGLSDPASRVDPQV